MGLAKIYTLPLTVSLALTSVLYTGCKPKVEVTVNSSSSDSTTSSSSSSSSSTSSSASVSLDGKWFSQCYDMGGGTFGRIFENANNLTLDIVGYFYGSDESCTGTPASTTPFVTGLALSPKSLSGVPTNYGVFDIAGGDVVVVYKPFTWAFHSYTIAQADIPAGTSWASWLTANSGLNDFVNHPFDNGTQIYHFYQVDVTPPTVSLTAAWDSKYESTACFDLNGQGTMYAKLAFYLNNGIGRATIKDYGTDSTCNGTYTLREMDQGDIYYDYALPGVIKPLTDVSGIPAGFVIMQENELDGSDIRYTIMHREDANHIQVMTDATTTHQGSNWSDWTSNVSDIAGFAADPAGFSATTGFVIPLQKTHNIHSFNGKWLSTCQDFGGGNYNKLYEEISNGVATNVTFYGYGTDPTCSSGSFVSSTLYSTNTTFELNSVTGVPDAFGAMSTVDHTNGDAAFKTIIHQISADTYDFVSIPPSQLPSSSWGEWKTDLTGFNDFVNAPTSIMGGVFHMTRVSGPPSP